MNKESQRLSSQISHLKARLLNFPDGNFYVDINQNHYKWYQSNGNQQAYIPKSQKHLAEQLAFKKYLNYLLKESIQEKNAIDFYLKHHNTHPPKSEELLTNPEYNKLLAPNFQPISKELKTWAMSPYTHNSNHPENLIHPAASGIMVRSKSESLIDLFLYKSQIPFRYECELILNGIAIYPDFTIRHPLTGQYFYWEHFGKMDDPAYCSTVLTKLRLYLSNHIISSMQLITTYETKDHPLSSNEVENVLQTYFQQSF